MPHVFGHTDADATYGMAYTHSEDDFLTIQQVLLVIWDKDGEVHSMSVHQFGAATLRGDSPHYADQAPLLASRQLKPVWFDESDIREHLEREYIPEGIRIVCCTLFPCNQKLDPAILVAPHEFALAKR